MFTREREWSIEKSRVEDGKLQQLRGQMRKKSLQCIPMRVEEIGVNRETGALWQTNRGERGEEDDVFKERQSTFVRILH
jgi:hypothetical protein